MYSGSLITILSVCLAIYALLPSYRRLDLSLRISWLGRTLLLVSAGVALYVVYLPILAELGLAIPFPWVSGFNEELTLFSIFLILTAYFVFKFSGRKIPHSRLKKWKMVSRELATKSKIDDLASLFEKYHLQLLALLKCEPWYVQANRERTAPYIWMRDAEKESTWKKFTVWISRFFPSRYKPNELAKESISQLLKSRPLIRKLAHSTPTSAAKFLTEAFDGDEEFSETFFKELMFVPHSQLLRELRDNQNLSHTGRYYINPNNALLSFLFADISVAAKTEVYRPVGNQVNEFIKKQQGKDNFYNQPLGSFSYSDAQWDCPIFMSILLFNIMVAEGLFQRSRDHLWLMYIQYFVKEILSVLDPAPNADATDEFPTKFHYLMYECFSAQCSWFSAIAEVDGIPDPNEEERWSDFIEGWVAKSLGDTLYLILSSEKLDDAKKTYFLSMALRCFKDLQQADYDRFVSIAVRHSLRPYGGGEVDQAFAHHVNDIYRRTDHVLWMEVGIFETELQQAMNK